MHECSQSALPKMARGLSTKKAVLARTEEERRLIWSVMWMLRSAKSSQLADVARTAAKWERGIGCFIKVRLMGGEAA